MVTRCLSYYRCSGTLHLIKGCVIYFSTNVKVLCTCVLFIRYQYYDAPHENLKHLCLNELIQEYRILNPEHGTKHETLNLEPGTWNLELET
jgi:hypothetical protein